MAPVAHRRFVRALRILGWTVLGLVLAVYIGLPVAMAIAATWPSRAAVGGPPAGFREVTLRTSDAKDLGGWYSPPGNGAAVIVVPGAGSSRESVRQQAQLLAAHGYGVLAIDLRGHGTSSGRTNRLGWQGTRDVRAAVDFLLAQNPSVRIGGLGYSMGGEVLLGATGECPEIRAVVADGATRRCTEELLALPSKRPIPENFVARVMYAAVRVLAWERPPQPLLGEMLRSKATAFLLVAAGANDLEVDFNQLFARTLGERASLWVAPDVGHTGAFERYRSEYEDRVLEFLDGRLAPQ